MDSLGFLWAIPLRAEIRSIVIAGEPMQIVLSNVAWPELLDQQQGASYPPRVEEAVLHPAPAPTSRPPPPRRSRAAASSRHPRVVAPAWPPAGWEVSGGRTPGSRLRRGWRRRRRRWAGRGLGLPGLAWRDRPCGRLSGGRARCLDHEDPGRGDDRGLVAGHTQLDAPFLAGAGEPRGVLEHPDDHEIPSGQVTGGRVHRHQPVGVVQEQRAGQDGEHDQAGAERRAAVDPGGRAQAVGWGRRGRHGSQIGQGRRSVGDGAASAEDA
jgi:hypothetical protein